MTKIAANLTLIIVGSILSYLLWNDNIEFRFDSEKENQEIDSNDSKNEPLPYDEPDFENNPGIVEERYDNLNKKIVRTYQGQGKTEETIEEIIYAENGEDIIGYTNYQTKQSMKTIFNQNGKKIKEIYLKNEKPINIWKYYNENDELIGTIDFNKKTLLSKILGEWVLKQDSYNIKKIFFKDKMLEQWKIDIDNQFWVDLGIDKYRCPPIYGEDICQDKMTFNNHLSFPIEYPTIKSIQDKQHIIVNTSKIEIFGSSIKNKEQRIGKIEEDFINGFYIQLINDSTLRITEKDGNVFEYRKVY